MNEFNSILVIKGRSDERNIHNSLKKKKKKKKVKKLSHNISSEHNFFV